MKRLLHIVASPRGDDSSTLKIARNVVERFRGLHPDGEIDTLDLFGDPLPPMTVEAVGGKYRLLSGKDLDERTRPAWDPILAHIERFLSADVVLITTPMWNFGMPYVLKHYFDVIVQPRYLFRYTATGPEGLASGKKVIVVTTRGGEYTEGPARAMDHLEPALRTILGFVGIADPVFVNAQPMAAAGPEVARERLEHAQEIARGLSFESAP